MKQKFTILLAAILLLTTHAFTAFGQTTYEKVTSAPTDWTGEYLLVFENDATTAYCWTGVDAASCYEELTISGNSISATDVVTISIVTMDGGYSIQVNGGANNGKYIYGQSGSNIIKFGTSPELNTLECESDGVKITSNTSVMRFNSASNNLRFRYFKSASYTNQQVVQLYKENSGGQATVATPTFSPLGGIYTESQSVTISCATDGADIYYTNDGTEPTESSSLYSSAIEVSETTTLKAKAFKTGSTPSGVATATYTFPELITIEAAHALANDAYAMVQGVVTFIDGRNVYVQDNAGGICLFLNTNTVPSSLVLGDLVQAFGQKTVYKGLIELQNIDGSNASEFSILSSGNELPLATKTIAEVLADATDALQCTRVKIEEVTIGTINTSGNTPLTQGESSINIYKVPALTGIEEGDVVDVIGVIGYYNNPQIRVANAEDIVLHEIPVIPDPVLTVSVTELSDFQYMFGSGPSAPKSFTVAGTDLTANVTLTAPEHFELSLNANTGYSDNTVLTLANGNIEETTIYVRLVAGLEVEIGRAHV